jgi:hypothetical protein
MAEKEEKRNRSEQKEEKEMHCIKEEQLIS